MVQSAGLLVFRRSARSEGTTRYEVFLTHPGGPFWAKKDDWSIPKGECEEGETSMQTIEREFYEETGMRPLLDNPIDLGEAKASGSKRNHIWAVEADLDVRAFHCISTASMQWPPRSGQEVVFPENDRAEWFELSVAYGKVFKSQVVFIERLAEHLGVSVTPPEPAVNASLF